ncbi:hypothetical protein NSA50_07165 [Clostridium sp. DSM 100503]|nr:hypothetical protein [Clostridium sp. DSM 100503]MCR1950841.1 hypothetical protein [Clostridium sp. DSM 100503]
MEENVEKKSVGAGIITMSVLDLFGQFFITIGCLVNIFAKDLVSNMIAEAGVSAGEQATTTDFVITLAISLIITIAVILILCKKPIGAFIFIGIEVLSFIYSAITSGVSLLTLLNLVFPALMIFFLYKKKDIYFVK